MSVVHKRENAEENTVYPCSAVKKLHLLYLPALGFPHFTFYIYFTYLLWGFPNFSVTVEVFFPILV